MLAAAPACSSTPTEPARARFIAQLQQPGIHRFDAVQVGRADAGLTVEVATCVANAFEHDRWPLEAALDGKVPPVVDVKMLNLHIDACQKDPGTTTISPFG